MEIYEHIEVDPKDKDSCVAGSLSSECDPTALQKAQQALTMYLANENSLNNKDWGDVVQWVLPEAKVEFLLNDLKKKEQIFAKKLATLPNNWTTYIPNAVNIPAVAAMGV
jgi:hypothetical protein